jgi:putative lipoic acid-binding regulatory protein
MQDRIEFYKKLKSQLDDTSKWPGDYMYKFIVPAAGNGIELIEEKFEEFGAVITTRNSKAGKYTSVTIRVVMPSSEMVILKYRECEDIEGLISL